jgi:CHASE2 domain-containing sensor protein
MIMTTPKHPRKKKKLSLEYLVINLFVFIGIWVLSQIVLNVAVFNAFTNAFKDFTLTDMYYQIHSTSKMCDSVILVNIDTLNRGDIATVIEKIEKGKPKVMGVDIIFDEQKDSVQDAKLKKTLNSYDNLVLPYSGSPSDIRVAESKTHDYFGVNSYSYANVYGGGTQDPQFTTIRFYYPVSNNVPAFSTAIMQKFDSVRAAKLLSFKGNKAEIKYYGNLDHFPSYSYMEVLDPALNLDKFKNKIVLLGYWDNSTTPKTLEDRYFTPMNPKISGRSHPDMYGIVIQANILRMAIDGDFLYDFPNWMNWLLAFLLSWMILPLFIRWWTKKAVWFHLYTMLLQLFLTLLFLLLTLVLYSRGIKIESHSILIAVLLLGDFILFYDSIVQFCRRKFKWNFHSKFFESTH